jgi:hypothetical protein
MQSSGQLKQKSNDKDPYSIIAEENLSVVCYPNPVKVNNTIKQ